MALEGPLRSSTGSIISSYSAHSDIPVPSSNSPALQPSFRPMSSGSPESSGLRPSSAAAARSSPAPYQLLSPSDIVGPSPVTSVGTETTEIDDEASDEARSFSSAAESDSHPQFPKLRTNISDQLRQTTNEAVSVIHAPESFHNWTGSDTYSKKSESTQRSSPRQSPKAEEIVMSTPNDRALKAKSMGLPTPPPLSTDIKPVRYSVDSATPRAQNLQDVLGDPSRIRSSSASSLELIPETKEPETDVEPDLESYDDEDYSTPVRGDEQEDSEIQSLQSALKECWVLCNTLASLSTHHRERVFSTSGTPDGHEKAWKCCWKLCQSLYDNRDEIDSFNVKVDLDLCRDFCQALFDVRMRPDGMSDSILRVSFELNNHLYSAQDNRNLPEAFQERTLDFYITLCHRLMKQPSAKRRETGKNRTRNYLPQLCKLAGNSVTYSAKGGLKSAQTEARRGPASLTFFSFNREAEADGRASRQSNRSKRDSQKGTEKHRKPLPVPETPVTEFEDTPLSPESQSPQAPNILVLGTDSNRGGRWPSSASNLSSYSQSSQRTSSTATTATTTEDVNLMRIKALVLKTAMNVGFSRDGASDGHGNPVSLQAFVRNLPPGSFGSLPSHATLLQNYKNLVVADSSFRQPSSLPPRGKRVSAMDMAKSVAFMTNRSSQYGFLRDLFKIVYGFHIEEIDSRKKVAISV
ncbi:hypothetical protein EKO27_g9017 [Xylaria grammica]|uniref:DUF7624 domain-containing protein n=1 Tax=Xylaria grammica TaxID=363999 RepID=A0A439CVD2_9PEZI|nr:hypothetical protein EKO27_g9017 [Xylaria grammica]